ncbi:hypothetical protein ACA910_009977 [Epithemia clementina (nom. ined.)]
MTFTTLLLTCWAIRSHGQLLATSSSSAEIQNLRQNNAHLVLVDADEKKNSHPSSSRYEAQKSHHLRGMLHSDDAFLLPHTEQFQESPAAAVLSHDHHHPHHPHWVLSRSPRHFVTIVDDAVAATPEGVTEGGVEVESPPQIASSQRALVVTITTTQCPSIRSSDSFRARLDLLYLYQIEYTTTTTTTNNTAKNTTDMDDGSSINLLPDLSGIDRAVATALASTLNQCDSQQRPAYAIQISAIRGHELSNDNCTPSDPLSTCQIVRGQSSILLDRGASDLVPVATAIIDLVLNDVERINKFTWSTLTQSKLLTHISENVVLLGDTSNETPTGSTPMNDHEQGLQNRIVIIIALATIALLLLLMCLYSILHKWHCWQHMARTVTCRGRSQRDKVSWRYWRSRRRRRRQQARQWKEMEDDSLDEDASAVARAWMMAASTLTNLPSSMTVQTRIISPGSSSSNRLPALEAQIQAAMAVSDLTSDSGSIKSSLKMDSIKEEDYAEHQEDDENDKADNNQLAISDMATPEQAVTTPISLYSPDSDGGDKERPVSLPYCYSSSSPSPDDDRHYYKYTYGNTNPDDSEEEMVEYPSFSAEGLPEVGSILSSNRSIWDTADMPLSYYDNSDPEADTPLRINVLARIDAFDALGIGTPGDSYLADVSFGSEGDDGDILMLTSSTERKQSRSRLLLPTLANLSTSQSLRRRDEKDDTDSDVDDDVGDDDDELSNIDKPSITGIPHEDDEVDKDKNGEAASSDNMALLNSRYYSLGKNSKLSKSLDCQFADSARQTCGRAGGAEMEYDESVYLQERSSVMDSSENDEFRRVLKTSTGSVQPLMSSSVVAQKKSKIQLQVVHKDVSRRNSAGSTNCTRLVSPEACEGETVDGHLRDDNPTTECNPENSNTEDPKTGEDDSSDEQDFYTPESVMGGTSGSMGEEDSETNGFLPVLRQSADLENQDLAEAHMSYFTPRGDEEIQPNQQMDDFCSALVRSRGSEGIIESESEICESSDLSRESCSYKESPKLVVSSGGSGEAALANSRHSLAEVAITTLGQDNLAALTTQSGENRITGGEGEQDDSFHLSSDPEDGRPCDDSGAVSDFPDSSPSSSNTLETVVQNPKATSKAMEHQRDGEPIRTVPLDQSDGHKFDDCAIAGQKRTRLVAMVHETLGNNKTGQLGIKRTGQGEATKEAKPPEDRESKKRKNADENGLGALTSPEGVQFLEDSSPDSRVIISHTGHTRDRSLEDLRLLGPVVTDTTSEDASLLRSENSRGDSSFSAQSDEEEDEEQDDDDDSSSARLKLPLPYLVSGNKKTGLRAQLLDNSVLSDITNVSDSDSDLNTSFVEAEGTTAVSI